MTITQTQAVVLAAGRSSRFKAPTSKLLAPLCGQPILLYILRLLDALNIPTVVVANPHDSELVSCIAKAQRADLQVVTQLEPRGTGNALASAQEYLTENNILVLNGDVPLITRELITNLYNTHITAKSAVTFCTSIVQNPHGYGRVITSEDTIYIVEERDCTKEQAAITRINAGVYLFDRNFLDKNLALLTPHQPHGEFYITDLIAQASIQKITIQPVDVAHDIVRGVNTLAELNTLERITQKQILEYWIEQGVRFINPETSTVDVDVILGERTTIHPGAQILGKTIIGSYVTIHGGSIIQDTIIGDHTIVYPYCVLENSTIEAHTKIGPFAHVHRQCTIQEKAHIGNFVEAQQTIVGKKTKAKHLTYLGNTQIGEHSNIGAGTITCNYDGKSKHKTIIGDRVFIGSNNTLIAPITIEHGAYTAAGSTITTSVPHDSLAIARARQENKIGYAEKLRKPITSAAPEQESKPSPSSLLNHDI